jgi:hypothetical protein
MTEGKVRGRSARVVVGISSSVFIGFGAAYLLFPAQLAQMFGIQLTSASALADLRAMYAGVPLSISALLIKALRDDRWLAPSLFVIMASLGGAAGARIYSILVSGVPNDLVLGFLGAELLGFVWMLKAYRALGGRAGRASAAPRSANPTSPGMGAPQRALAARERA